MDSRLLLITGCDYPIPECQLSMHQPTIEEISMIGEEDFFIGIQILTLNKMMFDMDKTVLEPMNNFQIFMTIIEQAETIDKKNAVLQVLFLLFPDKKISFTPRSIIINSDNQIIMIDENNFEALQNAISNIFCLKSNNENTYNPENEAAKKIAEKLMKGRQRVAEQKGENRGSIFVQYISILSIGLHIPITKLKKYTVFMIYDSLQRLGLWTEYDLDIRSRLAGATPQSQPENWMKNMY